MSEGFALKNVARDVPTPRCRRAVAAALPGVLWTARGYKPGYLWDVNEPTESTVADCLRLCGVNSGNDENLLVVTGDDVRAVRLGRDVLLCNVPETLRRLADVDLAVKFVDVSAGLRSPKALASPPLGVRGMLASLRRRLADVAASPSLGDVFADLESGEWNLCTAFGVLLGYPVVYWFEGSADAGNCLAMEELTVVRVRSATTAGRRDAARTWGTTSSAAGVEDDVYSFSFPVALNADLRPHVDAWWQRLRARAAAGDFELTRVDEVMCCPVVAL